MKEKLSAEELAMVAQINEPQPLMKKSKAVEPGAKLSPGFLALIRRATVKAVAVKANMAEVINVARTLTPRMLPAQGGPVREALARFTRIERMAVNALAGTRPTNRDRFGNIVPMHPLRGSWLQELHLLGKA